MIIFADTSALYALVTDDENHRQAKEWFSSNRYRLVATDYIIDELLTLLMVHKSKQFALDVSQKIKDGRIPLLIEKVSVEQFHEAWNIFHRFSDKQWSLTDCASYVFIKARSLSHAFAFDHHFDQFGFVNRLPRIDN